MKRGAVDKLGRLSPFALAIVGVLVASGVGGGGYYAYQVYDWVEHDNDFCLSCHLMEEPYELFAESAHQGLGCKACHQPTLVGRSQMALTQIIDSPEELSVHADVPNEVCANCHIGGDPERWRSIAQSEGHRVHLESEDPALEGLQCVECHSTSIHEFAPIDRTCAQSGCHTDNTIRLGAMSELTIHCAACHGFVEPAPERTTAALASTPPMQPGGQECFTCHVMRTLVDMPEDDPHEAGCGSCHNPHTQEEPADAVESCATAGCHQDVGALTPFHEGLETSVVTDCLHCHVAHDFELSGADCVSCHQGVATAPVAAVLQSGAGVDPSATVAALIDRVRVQERPDFSHDDHPDLACTSCHSSEVQHGAPTVTTIQDCRSCHHTEPLSRTCASCHTPDSAPDETFQEVRAVSFSVGTADPSRTLTFPHGAHADLDCASCHSEGIAMAVSADLDCASCHEDHHTAESTCASCHTSPPVAAHPPEQAHLTCSGSGCHTDVPFDTVPRTRAFCLGCHQSLVDHEPGRTCADCHTLPAPLGAGG